MHIYIHSPFCVGVCDYCIYNPVDMFSINKLVYDKYYEGLLNQIKDFKDVLENKKIDSIYIGGGTPSIMPFDVLKKISREIPNWSEIKVKVFEANPISMTKGKIDVLSELGFTYLALGVQTLNREELMKQNRKSPKDDHIKEITQYALDKEIHVNYDLMAFLDDDIDKDIDRLYHDLMVILKEYKPPSVDIYPMYQKLENRSSQEILIKTKKLRKNLKKVLYFNKDYHVAGGNSRIDILDDSNILDNYRRNYYLINIPDETFFKEKKVYSCSGPEIAPSLQNVISFGGYKDAWTYSYDSSKRLIYYTQLDDQGNALYVEERC